MDLDYARENGGDVGDVIKSLYQAYGNRAEFDRHLHPEITIWETDEADGLLGLTELDELRDSRAAGDGAGSPSLSVKKLLVDRWGESFAVARYELHADADGTQTAFRVTDVLIPRGEQWRIIHHHSEHLGEVA